MVTMSLLPRPASSLWLTHCSSPMGIPDPDSAWPRSVLAKHASVQPRVHVCVLTCTSTRMCCTTHKQTHGHQWSAQSPRPYVQGESRCPTICCRKWRRLPWLTGHPVSGPGPELLGGPSCLGRWEVPRGAWHGVQLASTVAGRHFLALPRVSLTLVPCVASLGQSRFPWDLSPLWGGGARWAQDGQDGVRRFSGPWDPGPYGNSAAPSLLTCPHPAGWPGAGKMRWCRRGGSVQAWTAGACSPHPGTRLRLVGASSPPAGSSVLSWAFYSAFLRSANRRSRAPSRLMPGAGAEAGRGTLPAQWQLDAGDFRGPTPGSAPSGWALGQGRQGLKGLGGTQEGPGPHLLALCCPPWSLGSAGSQGPWQR